MNKLVFILLIAFLTSCSGVKITNNWDKDVDFDSFNTFSFYPWDKQNNQVVSDYDKQTILGSIKNELIRRGYRYVEEGGDMVVSVFVIIEQQTSYQAYSNHYAGWAGYGGGWGYYGSGGFYGYGWGPPSSTIYATNYNQGTLIIDIFRMKDKSLIWQGTGSGEVTENYERRDRRLPRSISQVFRRFPKTPLSEKKLAEMEAEN